MSTELEVLESRALKLTPEERAHLADALLASLHPDPALEAAWSEEIERRLARLESGESTYISAEEAVQRARDALR